MKNTIVVAVASCMLVSAFVLADMDKCRNGSNQVSEVACGTTDGVVDVNVASSAATMNVAVVSGGSGTPTWDGSKTANCIAITGTSQQFTYVADKLYQITVAGNSAYVLEGANPTATTSVGGFGDIVPDGGRTAIYNPTGAKIAFKGNSAAGVICFLEMTAG